MKSKTHIINHRDDTQIVLSSGFDGIKTIIHYRQLPNQCASFAMELLRVHSGITSQADGEDSTGRSKLRREIPAEAVKYACEIAALAFNEFKDRGWLIPLPDWKETEELAKPGN